MILIHGQNSFASRNYLNSLINQFKGEVVRFEGQKVSLTDLTGAVESQTLSLNKRFVIIENILSRRPSQEKEQIITYLKKENPNNLVIWEDKLIDGRQLKSLTKATIHKFDTPPIIWRFLDSFLPNNQKICLSNFHQTLKINPVENVYYLLSKRVADLIIANDLGEDGLKKLAPWQQANLCRQAKKFNLAKLIMIYQKLLDIDYQIKSGQTELSLSFHLDLLIANL